jgi:hypothetical protein
MKIMKPYLDLFIISQYSILSYKKAEAFSLLHEKLHLFIRFNPSFGRRKVRIVTNNPFDTNHTCQYYYDDRYLPFHSTDKSTDFMKLHLETVHTHRIPIVNVTRSQQSESSDESDNEIVIRTHRQRQYIVEDPHDDIDNEEDEDEEEDDIYNEEEEDHMSIDDIEDDEEDDDEEEDV